MEEQYETGKDVPKIDPILIAHIIMFLTPQEVGKMINKIVIENDATFDKKQHILEPLRKLNFFYGANGSGKTTISRILGAPAEHPDSRIYWENNVLLSCHVYNIDFVNQNFGTDIQMPGVFTLGKEERETKARINEIENDIGELEQKCSKLECELNGSNGIGGLREKLNTLIEKNKEIFWRQKQKYDSSPIREGLVGFLNSKENFMKEILAQSESNNEELLSFKELESKAKIVFNKHLELLEKIRSLDFSKLMELNKAPILEKKIVGKDDVDISGLVKKLNNSDWVKQGINYLDDSDGACPFCQRPISRELRNQLIEYFDDSYENDLRNVRLLDKEYKSVGAFLLAELKELGTNNSFLQNDEGFEDAVHLFKNLIEENEERIHQKATAASTPIALHKIDEVVEKLIKKINEANEKIEENNEVLKINGILRVTLTKQIWRYLTYEIAGDITLFKNEKAEITKKIDNSVKALKESKDKLECNLREKEGLEAKLTSIIPTRDEINQMLKKFGFSGFSLSLSADKKGYQILRDDGNPVNRTLSEGERNFITFLYFFISLRGSSNSSGQVEDQVIVIDDPVSSMDQDVLFTVSTLIRSLYKDITDGTSHIKQLFLFSHNIYFYREVTFADGIKYLKKNSQNVEYGIVSKAFGKSKVDLRDDNPIQSTYELLWLDIKAAKANPTANGLNVNSLQNTMRRILEHYFKYYGGISLRELPDKIGEEDRLVVRSLVSWMNDGSHSSFEDLCCASAQGASVTQYLDAFRTIFEKTGHMAHYNMMMGEEYQ